MGKNIESESETRSESQEQEVAPRKVVLSSYVSLPSTSDEEPKVAFVPITDPDMLEWAMEQVSGVLEHANDAPQWVDGCYQPKGQKGYKLVRIIVELVEDTTAS